MELERHNQLSYPLLLTMKEEISKRDNIIKLLTAVIEAIKTDANIKTQQLDFLIEHMKNHNYDIFDYQSCIESIDEILPFKAKLKEIGYIDIGIDINNDHFRSQSQVKKIETLSYDLRKGDNRNIAREILKYLNARDLANASLVCKFFYETCRSNKMWDRIYFNEFNSFLFFDDKDLCKVVPNAKEYYEHASLTPATPATDTYPSIFQNDSFFKAQYTLTKKLSKHWEKYRPVVTTISTEESVTCLNLDQSSNELIYSAVDGSASLFRLYSYRTFHNEELCMQHHRQSRICDKLSTFQGHLGPIWCIDRNEDTLFTGSYDKTIKLWHVKTGKCKASIRAHASWVSSLNYDPSYDMLVSSSWDSTIKLWNMKTLHNDLTLTNQIGNYIYCVRANLPENEIIAGTEMKTVDLWDITQQVKTGAYSGHAERINNIKFSNNFILSGSSDKSTRVWDKRTGHCEILLTGHKGGVTQVEFDPIHNRVFTSSEDTTIKMWDIRKQKEIRTLVGHSKGVLSIACDQGKLISGSKDNTIRIWNFLTS